jgi:succinyl-CoA synthetase alpha subunit
LRPPTRLDYSTNRMQLNNILAHNTDGVFEGVAIGGDRYPGSTFTDHILRYQDDPRSLQKQFIW